MNVRKGFTLVELSIVLVIIGLLIGGILVAQSMVGTAKIQAQIRQFQQFDIATTNFKNKYKQLPGDNNLFPRDANPPSNNNGKIEDAGGSTPPASLWMEPYFYFIDLSVSGHLKDDYHLSHGSYDFGLGKQFPPTAIGRGGIVITSNAAGELFYSLIYRGSSSNETAYTTLMAEGSLSPAEALAIDSKADNGNPVNGNIASIAPTVSGAGSFLPFNADSQSASDCINNNAYNVTLSATNLCRLVVRVNVY